jgi:NAD(P)H dehydrogenase (quinone)
MILVTGAGGKTGSAVIKALVAHGESVHAFVHREAQRALMRTLGATGVSVGSLHDADAVTRAAKGAHAIYHICPNVSPFELTFGRAVITGVTRAGVRRFIYHSVLHPQIATMPHHWEKLRVEEMLFTSACDVTILQPTAYMQNIFVAWQSIVTNGIYRVPYPASTRISLVDLDDVAAAAAAVATNDNHIGATYELVGTAPLSQSDVANIISMELGKSVVVEQESADAWAARARDAGMGDYQRDTLLRMFRYYEQHGLVGNPNELKWLLGREPASLASVIERAAAGPI